MRDLLDPKYTKICLYAGLTLVASLALVIVLYLTRGFWGRLWDIIIAVLRPIVIGGMFAYLLSPLVRRFERSISRSGERTWARPAAVALAYLMLFLIGRFFAHTSCFLVFWQTASFLDQLYNK